MIYIAKISHEMRITNIFRLKCPHKKLSKFKKFMNHPVYYRLLSSTCNFFNSLLILFLHTLPAAVPCANC
jgi:hypothetical protein